MVRSFTVRCRLKRISNLCRKRFLHLLFVSGITRTEIVGNAMIMMMAGYETTANTIILLAYCVATEPEVQEKLYKEIVEANEKFVSIFFLHMKNRQHQSSGVVQTLFRRYSVTHDHVIRSFD